MSGLVALVALGHLWRTLVEEGLVSLSLDEWRNVPGGPVALLASGRIRVHHDDGWIHVYLGERRQA